MIRRALAVAGALALGAAAVGCELIVDFDRSLIDGGGPGPGFDASFADNYNDVALQDTSLPDNYVAPDTNVPDNNQPDTFTGVDSGIDSGVDSGVDAGVDTGVDSGVDAGVDANVVTLVLTPSGTVPLGSTNQDAATANTTINLVNQGTIASGTLTIQLTGGASGDFHLDPSGTCVSGTTSLAPADAGACTIVVNYEPVNPDAGAESTTLGVTGASGGNASDTLTGTGQ